MAAVRTFKDGTTYDTPAIWIDTTDWAVWRGPISPDSTMHFAKLEGLNDKGAPIWVLRASACPETCVKVTP